MFYSHTFLARKGPLGTVWCAAHLQHRLKKSHYISIDLTSTVERIMFPEVPLALRMSGHLLLGVVRIYSKKVQYLYDDYNVFLISLRNACPLVEISLPEGATYAPYESVTMPENFDLDALDSHYDFCYEGNQDKYRKSFEEITLPCGGIPIQMDPHITINFDEDILRLSSSLDHDASGLGPMAEDAPSETVDRGVGVRNPNTGPNDENYPEIIPEFEGLRENVPVWPYPQNDVLPPDTYLEEQIIKDRKCPTSVLEETSFVGEVPVSPQHFQGPINSPISDHAADIVFNNSLGRESLNLALNPSPLNLALNPSPPVEAKGKPSIDKPKGRPRKRKQRYDEVTVLTNKVMKAALDNCNDIRRKRKCLPSSDLDVWKSNNRLRKEKMFSGPIITGLCENLRSIYADNVISSKPHLIPEKEALGEPNFTQLSPIHVTSFSPAPQMPEPMNAHHEEIEILQNYEGPVGDNILPDGIHDNRLNSPRERDDSTPAASSSIGSPRTGTTRQTTSTGTIGSDWETPSTFMQEHTGFDNTGLSPIPEDMVSAEIDDLNFLASEDCTPTNLKTTEGFSSLSGATRKVAQYLKRKCSPISEDLDGDLSLNQLLEGKTRKVSARMLFQTLVLKSGGFLDLKQEEAYGDIKLRLTPKLFKDQS